MIQTEFHIKKKANSKVYFPSQTPIRGVHKHFPEAEYGEAQEETQGAPNLGQERGEGVDLKIR